MTAYWLTFKPLGPGAPKGWPTEKLHDLVARFEADPGQATEWWRIASHQSARVGDRVYLFKQGVGPRGIFGVGRIVGGPEFRDDPNDNEGPRYRARVRFDRLVDPDREFLLPLAMLGGVVSQKLIRAQASGYGIPSDVESALEQMLAGPDQTEATGSGEIWSGSEVTACVAAYFAMLRHDLAGHPYVKARYNEQVRQATGRSKGSVEFKFGNVSAVLDSMGLRWIEGYKPRGHGQVGAIRQAVDAYLDDHQGLADDLEAVPENVPDLPPSSTDVFTNPPPVSQPPPAKGSGSRKPQKRDRALSDARNRKLGLRGEEWVVRVECDRLTQAGRSDLAAKVIHTARDEGDGAGYDIASFNADGSPRLIEVKTTNGPADTPFYVTANEVRVSAERASHYWLYRVYAFSKEPRIYTLQGALDGDGLRLEPTVFRAIR